MTAAIVQLTAGVGPVECRRFVAQLATRLEAVCAAAGLTVAEVVTTGVADAPRSIALHVDGDAATALAGEVGTHCLVERSAGRGRAARKRWFAAVSVHPASPLVAAPAPPPRAELIVTACRAGGPGGQHVNKVSSAVRVEHVPTGLVVRSAGERSQHANLTRALARLAAALHAAAQGQAATDAATRRRSHYQVERGAAVRTYARGADGGLALRGPA
ncbi:MAG: peptide chain release factor-like protein [Kofleriaceae bacterium]